MTVTYAIQPLSGMGITGAMNVSSTAQYVINH